VVPPTPPFNGRGKSTVDATNEIFPGSPGNPRWPYGLGFRVPMLVISPWSKGSWVCSEVFDHTSSRYDVDDDTVELIIVNLGKNDCRITVDNAYGNDRPVTRRLRSGQSDRQQWNLKKTFGRHGPRISASSGRPPGKRPRQRERSGAGPAPELSATRR
jgi:phosphoesterase family protein